MTSFNYKIPSAVMSFSELCGEPFSVASPVAAVASLDLSELGSKQVLYVS